MAGLVPAIHVFISGRDCKQNVIARALRAWLISGFAAASH
jgi:hypothetical protein